MGKTPKSKQKPDVILDACLSYIHFLMMRFNFQDIKEKTLSSFSLTDLKKAREALFASDPESKGYNGPNNSSEKEKAAHCFDLVFNKLKELDAKSGGVIIACPSVELNVLPNTSLNHNCAAEFARVHKDINDLREKLNNVSTQFSIGNPMNKFPSYRDKLLGNLRDRSSSTSKRKRNSDNSSGASSEIEDDAFQSVRQDKNKVLRKNSGPSKVVPNENSQQGSKISINNKLPIRKFSVGTSKPHAGSRFKGVISKVPKAFISKCDLEAEPEDIIEHFSLEGVGVTNVEMAKPSRPSSRPPRSKSFIISFNKFEDYLKVMSGGVFLPEHVEVKKYFFPREPRPITNVEDSIRELDALLQDRPENSQLDVPASPSSAVTSSHSLDNRVPQENASNAMETSDVQPEMLSTDTKDSNNAKDSNCDLASSQPNHG